MNALRRTLLLLPLLLLLTVTVEAQEYKKTFNAARAAALAKDYATARAQYAAAANGADEAGDAEVSRQARYVAAQIDQRLGNAALKADNAESALQHYANGVAIFPDYIKNTYGQGLALKKLGRMDEALEAWSGILDNTQDRRTALAAESAIREHFYFQASSAVSKNAPSASDGDRALAALERSKEYVEPDSDYYYYVAEAQLAKGNNAECVAAANESLALHRGSRTDAAKIHFTKAEAQLRMGDTDGAKVSFRNAAYGSYKPSAEHYLSTL